MDFLSPHLTERLAISPDVAEVMETSLIAADWIKHAASKTKHARRKEREAVADDYDAYIGPLGQPCDPRLNPRWCTKNTPEPTRRPLGYYRDIREQRLNELEDQNTSIEEAYSVEGPPEKETETARTQDALSYYLDSIYPDRSTTEPSITTTPMTVSLSSTASPDTTTSSENLTLAVGKWYWRSPVTNATYLSDIQLDPSNEERLVGRVWIGPHVVIFEAKIATHRPWHQIFGLDVDEATSAPWDSGKLSKWQKREIQLLLDRLRRRLRSNDPIFSSASSGCQTLFSIGFAEFEDTLCV